LEVYPGQEVLVKVEKGSIGKIERVMESLPGFLDQERVCIPPVAELGKGLHKAKDSPIKFGFAGLAKRAIQVCGRLSSVFQTLRRTLAPEVGIPAGAMVAMQIASL
jgi:hypothetical protein